MLLGWVILHASLGHAFVRGRAGLRNLKNSAADLELALDLRPWEEDAAFLNHRGPDSVGGTRHCRKTSPPSPTKIPTIATVKARFAFWSLWLWKILPPSSRPSYFFG